MTPDSSVADGRTQSYFTNTVDMQSKMYSTFYIYKIDMSLIRFENYCCKKSVYGLVCSCGFSCRFFCVNLLSLNRKCERLLHPIDPHHPVIMLFEAKEALVVIHRAQITCFFSLAVFSGLYYSNQKVLCAAKSLETRMSFFDAEVELFVSHSVIESPSVLLCRFVWLKYYISICLSLLELFFPQSVFVWNYRTYN